MTYIIITLTTPAYNLWYKFSNRLLETHVHKGASSVLNKSMINSHEFVVKLYKIHFYSSKILHKHFVLTV